MKNEKRKKNVGQLQQDGKKVAVTAPTGTLWEAKRKSEIKNEK
jgi:hypothetical protein